MTSVQMMNSTVDQNFVDLQLYPIYMLLGRTRLLEQLDFIPVIVTGAVGFLLNSICLYIYRDRREFSLPIFDYLRVYTLNSTIIGFLSTFVFVSTSGRFIRWTNTYQSFAFFLYFDYQIINLGYFFGTMLDILITIDRVCILKPKIRRLWLKMPSPYILCLICLICTVIINWPYYLTFTPAKLQIPVFTDRSRNRTQLVTIWYTTVTSFKKSQLGETILSILYAFRDIFLMVLDTVLSIYSVYTLSVYLDKKSKLLGAQKSVASDASSARNQTTNTLVSQQTANVTSESRSSIKRMGIMVFIICFLSVVEHIIAIASLFYPRTAGFSMITYQYIAFTFVYMISFKHALNFFLFISFNKSFRSSFFKLFKRSN